MGRSDWFGCIVIADGFADGPACCGSEIKSQLNEHCYLVTCSPVLAEMIGTPVVDHALVLLHFNDGT